VNLKRAIASVVAAGTLTSIACGDGNGISLTFAMGTCFGGPAFGVVYVTNHTSVASSFDSPNTPGYRIVNSSGDVVAEAPASYVSASCMGCGFTTLTLAPGETKSFATPNLQWLGAQSANPGVYRMRVTFGGDGHQFGETNEATFSVCNWDGTTTKPIAVCNTPCLSDADAQQMLGVPLQCSADLACP